MTVVNGNGDGTFGAEQNFSLLAATGNVLALADLNNDGQTDFLSANSDGTISVLVGQQTVTATATGISVPGPVTQDVAASYGGDNAHAGSLSSTIPLQPVISTTQLTATPFLSTAGTPITLSATIGSTLSSPAGAGTVAFYNGTSLLATVNVSAGAASYSVTGLPPGTTSYSAVFSGSSALGTSTSSTVSIHVVPQSTTTLSVSTNAASSSTPIVLSSTVTLPGNLPLFPVRSPSTTPKASAAPLSREASARRR